jgi:RNA-directed DNA polymerase
LAKSFSISKRTVLNAFYAVKANGGNAGIDGTTIEEFEKDLKNNLYKIWNRMSSGCYFPPPVKGVAIPKKDGGKRILGIPTVGDRVAQMVAKMTIEPILDPIFHDDSYGYRPGKSAIQAVSKVRERCWRYEWVLEFDIRKLFDNINHELLMKAVEHHIEEKWVLLYVERWLKAPMIKDGERIERNSGTPQGGVISPILANLFMHYVFDSWMSRNFPENPIVRYADDGIVHCRTEEEAQRLRVELGNRFRECGLDLHPDKTRIIYCRKGNGGKGGKSDAARSFEFLGYEYRIRTAKKRDGTLFQNFAPAVSKTAAQAMRKIIRGWQIQKRADKSIEDLSHMFNPIIRGWINYYGHYNKSVLYPTFYNLNRKLVTWATRKYKSLRRKPRKAHYWLGRLAKRQPELFAHWLILGLRPAIRITGAV